MPYIILIVDLVKINCELYLKLFKISSYYFFFIFMVFDFYKIIKTNNTNPFCYISNVGIFVKLLNFYTIKKGLLQALINLIR